MSPRKQAETMITADLAGLRSLAEAYEDVMKLRVAIDNRFRRAPIPQDSIEPLHASIGPMERIFDKTLVAEYRRVVPESIRNWQQQTPGLGEHLLSRLLGHLGNPVVATPLHWVGEVRDDRHLVAREPFRRTVGQLWAYCGLGDPQRKRRRGMDVDEALAAGSPGIRAIMFNIADTCYRPMNSPYRAVYYDARATYAERVHAEPCVRCGPKGHPAPAGSPWNPGHQHAAALRKVAKAVLKDLWLASLEGEVGATDRSETSLGAPRPPSTRRSRKKAA